MTEIMTAAQTILTFVIQAVGDIAAEVIRNPLLLISIAMIFVWLGVKFIKSLIHV